METITIFKTEDGVEFNDKVDALIHENNYYKRTINNLKDIEKKYSNNTDKKYNTSNKLVLSIT